MWVCRQQKDIKQTIIKTMVTSAKEKKRVLDALVGIEEKLALARAECDETFESALQQHLTDREPILKRR